MPHKFDKGTVPATKRIAYPPGEAVKMLRELHELSQQQLAKLSGVPQPVISAIEHGRTSVGIERSKRLARVLHVHPAAIAFSDYLMPEDEARGANPRRKKLAEG